MEQDPLKLLIRLEKKYEEFGAVKLIAAPEWRPPFSFRFSDRGITTRIQHLHKLKYGKVKTHWMLCIFFCLYSFYLSLLNKNKRPTMLGALKLLRKIFRKITNSSVQESWKMKLIAKKKSTGT